MIEKIEVVQGQITSTVRQTSKDSGYGWSVKVGDVAIASGFCETKEEAEQNVRNWLNALEQGSRASLEQWQKK